MPFYTLYNKQRQVNLVHPQVGVWNSSDLDEAKELLSNCRDYLVSSGLSYLCDQIVIRDIETREEID